MADIFHEIEEDLRRDKLASFWKRFQTPIFVVAFLIVAATGAWSYYQSERLRTAEAANVRYRAASDLAQEGKREEAIAAFESLGKDGPKGYASLARLQAAGELAAVDKAKAIAAYDAIADDSSVDKLTQEVARLRAAILVMENGDRQKMERRLGPLMTSAGPFRYSAQEWIALDALENGDFDEAQRVFDLLLTDRDAPHAMRQRAAAYQGLLKAVRGSAKAGTPAGVTIAPSIETESGTDAGAAVEVSPTK
jgi:hypothetical protein